MLSLGWVILVTRSSILSGRSWIEDFMILGQVPLLKEVWEMTSILQGIPMYEGALDPWMTSLWHALHQMYPTFFPHGPDYVSRTVELLDQPKYQIIYHELDEMLPMISDATDSKNLAMEIERARSMSPGKLPYDDSTSATFLKMIRNDPLTKIGSGKDVRHFAFEFISSTIKYDVGDVLEVLPHQNPASMDAFIRRCDLDPEAFITVWPKQRDNCLLDGRKRSQVMPIKLKRYVELAMDVASASPRRYFFEVMSFFASAEHEKERLEYFASVKVEMICTNTTRKRGEQFWRF
ncbi:NADPH-dependent diflavin oxidoreductase 1 [Linum perenne]